MKDNTLRDILLSDMNIYKAILSVESYIYNVQLMDDSDIALYYKLKDKFNFDLFFGERKSKNDNDENGESSKFESGLINEIREIIKKIIDNDKEFFKTKVYFKLKKPKKGEYRPLHVAGLKDSIAIVAMLQILIFDMEHSDGEKMKFSNLTKLIPSNFYGNIPSNSPERLFESWQNKYKEYIEGANNKYAEYEKNGTYKYEVTLDLENFFPSINPLLVYEFIIKQLRIKFNGESLELVKKIIFKLLFFQVQDYDNNEYEFFKKLYYKDFKEIYLKDTKNLTRGIPQGLPQSYFFGNLIMIMIAKIYKESFDGEALFYVDDSYIYTNKELNEENFQKYLENTNEALKQYSKLNKESDLRIINEEIYGYTRTDFLKYISDFDYQIKVHTKEKSSFISVKDTRVGYKYLKFLSRLVSMGTFDFKTTFSDFEEIQLRNKFEKLIEAIEEEIKRCEKFIAKQNNDKIRTLDDEKLCENCGSCEFSSSCNSYIIYKEYFEKLKRFKRFFQFRVLLIQMQNTDEEIKNIKKELKNFKVEDIESKLENELFEIKLNVLDNYLINQIDENNNISDELKEILNKIIEFEQHYAKNVNSNVEIRREEYFYYYRTFKTSDNSRKEYIDSYSSIKKIISKRISINSKHTSYQKKHLNILQDVINKNKLVEYAFRNYDSEENSSKDWNSISCKDGIYKFNEIQKYETFCYWGVRSKYLRRYIVNTIISLILSIELNDNLYIARLNKKPLNYFELRLITAVRNSKLDMSLVSKIIYEYCNSHQDRSIDYTIFEAIDYYRIFAREPIYIDNLILIHQYTTELWENGSKYMHFYTLHNQSHAVELIKNINNIVKSIDFFKISKIDYYIIYISCYLHDISMVLYPKQERFLRKDWNESNNIFMSFKEAIDKISPINSIDQQSIKMILLNAYKKIDELFENEVRNKHAKDSARFIKTSNDFTFINEAILDIVADVCHAHGMDTRDVYHLKSNSKEHLVSKKFMMILLRLADLFDMSENRVSVPIFYNNKTNMSSTGRFHWISHLITDDFKIVNNYEFDIKSDDLSVSYFMPGYIREIVTIQININIDQLTTVGIGKNGKCERVCMLDYDNNNELILNIKSSEKKCEQENCNFICKWFMKKNWYLIYELSYLQSYLYDAQNYFKTTFRIQLKLNDNNILRPEDFDDLREYIENDY